VKALKSTTARGYGHRHQNLRKRWAKVVDTGDAYCVRCKRWIEPGTPWDLGHDDKDRTKYQGPEHAKCNRGAPHRKVPARRSRNW
jgi:hypothetical protein